MEWADAVAVSARAHGFLRDKSGVLQLAHGIEVASALGDGTDDERAAALLHDVLEDTGWAVDDLRRAGVPEIVIEAVEYVSRRENPEKERYLDFIERTARADGEAGRIARRVKQADLLVNMARVHELEGGESMLEKRYVPALERIRAAMRERGESP